MTDMLTANEIAEIVGISRNAVDNKIRRYGIKHSDTRIMPDGKKSRVFPKEVVDMILSGKRMGRPRHNVYYRVSVFSNDLFCFIVMNAGLTKGKAMELLEFYEHMGLIAKMLPCA